MINEDDTTDKLTCGPRIPDRIGIQKCQILWREENRSTTTNSTHILVRWWEVSALIAASSLLSAHWNIKKIPILLLFLKYKNQPTFPLNVTLTLIRPPSRLSSIFHAHCFQFLWSASAPFCPTSPLTPRDPIGPATPLSPLAASRPSRPGNPLYPLRPGRPGDPCRHVLGLCVIKEGQIRLQAQHS